MAGWRNWKTALVAGAMALCSTWASATFSTADASVSGDALLTLDSESGLAWLDLSATRGLSVAQVRTSEWLAQGFRLATLAEVDELVARSVSNLDVVDWLGGWAASPELSANLGGPTTVLAGAVGGDGLLDAQTQLPLVTLWRTRETVIAPGGDVLTDYPSPELSPELQADLLAYLAQSGSSQSQGDFLRRRDALVALDASSPDFGVFLVRNVSAVPEPATWAMMGLGLVGVWGVRRRRR